MTRHIAIVAGGSRGDVQPYIALGKGLRDAGDTVRIITTEDFEQLAHEAGLEFCSIGESIEVMLQQPEWKAVTEGGNFLRILGQMQKVMKQRAQTMTGVLPPLLQGADLIIAGAGGLGGAFTIAEQQRIPFLQAYVFPITPTSEFPSPLTPRLPLGGLLNKPSFALMRRLLWQTSRIADVATRKSLGLPPPASGGPFAAFDRARKPVIYGYSRHVVPPPSDWADFIQVTGYWYLDAPDAWQPPADLAAFLEAGAPPVYIGFGSMNSRDPEATARLALEAARLSGQRAVLASGWGGMSASALPDNVFLLKSAPHSWLFPRMAAVVHHGGAGTTAAGLRAGVPSIIVPFFGDQPYWGQRVAALGVGTAPLPRKRLTAGKLAAAIRQATSDATLRARAADLGERIRAEDGIGNAVAFVRQHFGQS